MKQQPELRPAYLKADLAMYRLLHRFPDPKNPEFSVVPKSEVENLAELYGIPPKELIKRYRAWMKP